METRKHYTAEQKVAILREHLENGVKISDLAERYRIHPRIIHRWRKKLFEGALETFSRKQEKKEGGKSSREVELEEKVASMQEVITEITTENLQLRKKYRGAI